MEEGETALNLKLCFICSVEVKEPYLKCDDCVDRPSLCQLCFSRGLEKGQHENHHRYEIMRNDFSLWDDSWTAAEEVLLLEAIDDCGLGNWVGVSKYLKRSSQECENHYWQSYIDCPKPPLQAPPVPATPSLVSIHPCVIPYKVCDAPPRPVLGSQSHADMAGYLAARGDFVTEYDNYAEMNLRDLEFSEEDDEIERELKIAKVEIYNNQLRERAWRKKIICDYGLIDLRRTVSVFKRFDEALGHFMLSSLRPLMRLFAPDDFESFLESESYEHELKHKINSLKEYRDAGLTKFGTVKMFRKLKRRRENNGSNRSALKEVLMNLKTEGNTTQWFSKIFADPANNIPLPIQNLPRKMAPPLDITGLPGYDKLNPNERELCSAVRLVPDAYLEFKGALVTECHRNGHLKLAQARTLIKIDVNKTRKIYDFLIGEGAICKESTG